MWTIYSIQKENKYPPYAVNRHKPTLSANT